MAQKSGIIPDGTRVRMKSGSEGWVHGEVVEYYDVIPVVGGMMIGGGMTPGYKVRVLEGKHKGEVVKLPERYVQKATGRSVITGKTGGKPGAGFAGAKPIPSWRRF